MNPLIRWLEKLTARIVSLEAVTTTPPSVLNAASGSVAVTAAKAVRGVFLTNVGSSGAVTFTLPPATQGMSVTAIVKAAHEIRLDPNGTETMALPSSGVQQAAGKYLTADAIGESGTWVCTVTGTWDYVGPIDGTWTVES